MASAGRLRCATRRLLPPLSPPSPSSSVRPASFARVPRLLSPNFLSSRTSLGGGGGARFAATSVRVRGDGADDDRSSAAPLVWLNKRMSELDLCSRREADRLIASGLVAVRGRRIESTLGQKVRADESDIAILWPGDRVAASVDADDEAEAEGGAGPGPGPGSEARASAFDWSRMRGDAVVLHKPRGYVSGQPEHPAVQIPAVRLLTRSNVHLRDDAPEDDELRETLSSGRYFHFARRFGMQRTRGPRPPKDARWADEPQRLKEAVEPPAQLPQLEATLWGYVPAGRLDQNSSGLIVFTRSGVLAKKLVSSSGLVHKEYEAHVVPAQSPTREEVRAGLTELPKPNRNLKPILRGGRKLWGDTRPLKPAVEAEWLETVDLRDVQALPGVLRLVLREGRKHQVRRMCREILGLHVVGLRRTRVGGISLEGLPEGRWRPLREEEAQSIFFTGRDGDRR